jgi:hypothetical protein
MAFTVLTNAKILAGMADLSGYSNMVELEAEADELDSTTFGSSGYKTVVGGMKKVTAKVGGLWSAADGTQPDDRLFADLGVSGVPFTLTPTGATVADPSYFTKVVRPSYQFGGKVGELLPFESTVVGDGTTLVRGQIADNAVRTATATTSVLSLTAPTATTRVYACIHVLAVSGTTPSLTVTLQGDNAIGFPSPLTVATGSAITAAGSQWIAGPVGVNVDSFYRLSYVISGTSPSFTVVASIGVAP